MQHRKHAASEQRFDPDLLDDEDPFEINSQAAHLFKHPHLGVDDIADVWASDPLFYPAKTVAHWLLCGEVSGRVLVYRWHLHATAIPPVPPDRLLRGR